MADAEQQTQTNRGLLASFGPLADTFSKTIAGIAIALYASGFLIVSLYHSKFGFVGTNPFRPRVLAAGAWFFLFTAIPVSIAVRYRTESWSRILRDAFFLWVGFTSLSLPLGNLLFEFSESPAYLLRGKWSWAVLVIGAAAIVFLQFVAKNQKAPRFIAPILSVSLTVYLISFPIRSFFTDHHFDLSSLALWFFAATLAVKLEFEVRSSRNLAEDGEWSKPLVLVFGLLLVFSRELYPHLKTSWGGGTPADVTVYLGKDSLLNPNKAVQAQLVEESDEGFYIVVAKESKAIFVPRNAVALIYFSDKAADSAVLQNIK